MFNIILEYYIPLWEWGVGGDDDISLDISAAKPYIGAQWGGGAIVGFRLSLEIFFYVCFCLHYGGLFLHVVDLFSLYGGHKQGFFFFMWVPLFSLVGGGGGVSCGGFF